MNCVSYFNKTHCFGVKLKIENLTFKQKNENIDEVD